jgi:hypothetical protein
MLGGVTMTEMCKFRKPEHTDWRNTYQRLDLGVHLSKSTFGFQSMSTSAGWEIRLVERLRLTLSERIGGV